MFTVTTLIGIVAVRTVVLAVDILVNFETGIVDIDRDARVVIEYVLVSVLLWKTVEAVPVTLVEGGVVFVVADWVVL